MVLPTWVELTPIGTLPFFWVTSAVTWLLTLHLAKLLGRIYGWLAKAMLVRV
jgi:hypothetical protein